MQDIALVTDCLEALRDALPPTAKVRARGARNDVGRVELRGPWGEMVVPFEIRQRLTPAVVELLRRRLEGAGPTERTGAPPRILFTEYVNPRQAETLRKAGIAFADRCGNVHVAGDALYVWVAGQGPPAQKPRMPRLTRPAAARVLFTLLQRRDRVEAPYRKLAALAGVAPDTIRLVFEDLEAKGMLQVWGRRKRRLTRLDQLFEVWTAAYEDGLRPKLEPARYAGNTARPTEELTRRVQDLGGAEGALLGGETAAARVLATLRPALVTIHVPRAKRRDVAEALQLVPRPEHGNVTLLDTFGTTNGWPDPPEGLVHLADPLLIHAELLWGGDDRAREAASALYDACLAGRLAR